MATQDESVAIQTQPTSTVEAGALSIGTGHEDEPLVSYLVAAAMFAGLVGSSLMLLLRAGRKPPVPDLRDLFLLSAATLRLSRLIARDRVMSPLRAPFTEIEVSPGGTLQEHPRGTGPTRAIGELVTCPRCTAMWASGALCMSYCWAPHTTRTVSLILASSALSDLANRLFAKLG